MFMLYDVFICHASADKAGFVSPLVTALSEANVEVWYDENALNWEIVFVAQLIRALANRGSES